jgi:hypothetical protein
MKLTQLFLCSAALALPLTLSAATKKNDDRWFEVEIILFSQLGDKSQLKESFPEHSKLPKYQRAEDLLAKYLNPDIRSLKQLLPSCDSPHYPESLVRQNAKLPALFKEKSLAEIALSANQLTTENSASEQNISHSSDERNKPTSRNGALSHAVVANSTIINKTLNSDKAETDTLSNVVESNLTDLLPEPAVSDEQREKNQRLVRAAEAEFQQLKFHYTPQTEPTILCRIEPQYFADVQANDPNFDYYGFTVTKVPLDIDGVEDIASNQTHLLSKASLQLGDIITDLRYSKNFRPILHMGWRQVARAKKHAVPVKVYAGDNFNAYYQQQLHSFTHNSKQQQAIARAPDKHESAVLPPAKHLSEQSLVEQSIAEQRYAEQLHRAQQARLTAIIAQLPQVSTDPDALLAALEQQNITIPLADEYALNNTLKTPPRPPVQPWFIDGFFNIHLKHYLFITADFNILEKNLAEIASAQLAPKATSNTITGNGASSSTVKSVKAIRFKQNRRVISGEVHYFDHPYMGMIVQIRPYTKPEAEESL